MVDDPANVPSGKVNAALAEFLEARERGVPWERDAFLAHYPDLADQLLEFLADRDALEFILGELQSSASIDAAGDRTLAGSGGKPHLPSLPRRFGNFELLEEIARGGMGIVYKARQIAPERIVALKMILAGQLAAEADVERFYAEAQAAAMLDHPHIIPLFEVGQYEGQHYFSMGYVEGGSLAQRLAAGPLPPRKAAAIIRTVSLAVHYAHQRGVIHRDLKPGNVLLDALGEVRVGDFGLAMRSVGAGELTATGQLVGTPSFMPPEQASGGRESIGPWSDVYSLGATLYALIVGRPPFQAASVFDTLHQVLDQDPVAPRQCNATIPHDMETITLKCLEKSPSRRYASAQALADDIQRFLNDEPLEARRPTRAYRVKKYVRRNKIGVFAGVAVAAAIVVGMVIASTGYFQARRQAELARVEAARKQQVNLFLKDTLTALGMPSEGELADLDRLFDNATLLAAEDQVESAKLLRLRATLRARIGRWEEATADVLLANRVAMDGGDWSFDSAIILLRAGLRAEYGRVCHAYIEQMTDTQDHVKADMVAKVSLLLPMGGPDFERACKLADYAATESGPAWHLPCVRLGEALAEYRRRRFGSALQWVQRAIDSEGITPRHRAAAYFIQAGAYAAQRRFSLAREAVQNGDSALNRPFDPFTKVFGDTWCDLAIANYLRREAIPLLVTASSTSEDEHLHPRHEP